VAHLRYKESDRLRDFADELRKLGAVVETETDALRVQPLRAARRAVLDPHGDHRLAMAFGLVALRVPSLEILDRECVGKSFPGFWECLRTIVTAD
jgi:3-phosphoshikimate 1-carboxyvinyltransferase